MYMLFRWKLDGWILQANIKCANIWTAQHGISSLHSVLLSFPDDFVFQLFADHGSCFMKVYVIESHFSIPWPYELGDEHLVL